MTIEPEWVSAPLVKADFVTDECREKGDNRQEGVYLTFKFPLETSVCAGEAKIQLPSIKTEYDFPLSLEVGKFYVNGFGEKVEIFSKTEKGDMFSGIVFPKTALSHTVKFDALGRANQLGYHELDIVGEWKE